jgi:hypothetical protein
MCLLQPTAPNGASEPDRSTGIHRGTTGISQPFSPDLALKLEFTSTVAPVQAEGTVAGRSFYFRARGDTWEFTVAEREGDDPSELREEDVTGGRAWYLSGTLPGRFEASWMPLEKATSLINECARAYVSERTA